MPNRGFSDGEWWLWRKKKSAIEILNELDFHEEKFIKIGD